MSKRNHNFERNPRDFYRTTASAVTPLIPFVRGATFAEPCAGDGALVDHLIAAGLTCAHASDIFPMRSDIIVADAMDYDGPCDRLIITNPPWDRTILHPMITHLRSIAPTWLLFDADWMHTTQSAPFMKFCRRIVSVGRVSWMDNGVSGMDNCCWYLFQADECETIFYGRDEKTERCADTMEMF